MKLSENVLCHELAGWIDAAIEVDRRNESFHGIGQQRLLLPSATHLLAAAQEEEFAQLQGICHLEQMRRADQVGLELRQAAFRRARVKSDQLFADDKAQDGVAQKLELLVV